MTFLAPGFFFASLAVAAGVVALHFIVTRQPRAAVLPTARFVPDLPATAIARDTRPSDLLLMLLRVLLVLAAGAGLARPVLEPSRRADIRVVLADASRSVTDTAAFRDSVRAALREGDALVVFGSNARLVASASDSVATISRGKERGSISAALIAAMRAASAVREKADSVELVIVSPFAAEELDAATPEIRKLWPGRARLVRAGIGASPDSMSPGQLTVQGAATDPVAVTARVARPVSSTTIIRDRGAGGATPGSDGMTIDWPSSTRPRGAVARARLDTAGGVASGAAVVVASFPRRWAFPADSIRGAGVVARWIDGEPAAIEWPSSSGCSRSVAVPVTSVGDLAIRADFIRLVEAITSPCAAQRPFVPASSESFAMLRGNGGLAPRGAFAPVDAHSWLSPWLLGLAVALALAELFVRGRKAARLSGAESTAVRRAA
jgi:hypothetical protein